MARIDDLNSERDDLAKKLVSLKAEQKRVILGSAVGLAAIPVGILWGGLAALAAIGITLGVVGVALYIINGHRFEYENRMRVVDDELRTLNA